VPDLALLRPREDFYLEHPTPADVFLVVEVSDSTLPFDRRVKLPLYAREAVPEVWLIELGPDRVTVHRDPSPTGYRITAIYQRGDTISPINFPQVTFTVEEILG
jgi:Uma2 family endonuclease